MVCVPRRWSASEQVAALVSWSNLQYISTRGKTIGCRPVCDNRWIRCRRLAYLLEHLTTGWKSCQILLKCTSQSRIETFWMDGQLWYYGHISHSIHAIYRHSCQSPMEGYGVTKCKECRWSHRPNICSFIQCCRMYQWYPGRREKWLDTTRG